MSLFYPSMAKIVGSHNLQPDSQHVWNHKFVGELVILPMSVARYAEIRKK